MQLGSRRTLPLETRYFTYKHGLRLSFAHFNAVVFCAITTVCLVSVEITAAVHKVFVDLLAIAQQVATLELFAVDGKAAVDTVIGSLLGDNSGPRQQDGDC